MAHPRVRDEAERNDALPIWGGFITRLLPEKGFGFLRSDPDGLERFFHRSACLPGAFEAFQVGEPVSFNPAETVKGPRALAVRSAD